MCFYSIYIYLATYPLSIYMLTKKLVVKRHPPTHTLVYKGEKTHRLFFHIWFSNTSLALFLRLASKLITKLENSTAPKKTNR